MLVGKHTDPIIYQIKPANGKGLVHLVNQHELQDLGCAHKEDSFDNNKRHRFFATLLLT